MGAAEPPHGPGGALKPCLRGALALPEGPTGCAGWVAGVGCGKAVDWWEEAEEGPAACSSYSMSRGGSGSRPMALRLTGALLAVRMHLSAYAARLSPGLNTA